MDQAVLLVSFGTSHKKARERSLEEIRKDLLKAGKNLPVFQAYTSGMIIKELVSQKISIKTVEEAVVQALDDHVRRLYVVPTHMIPGAEFQKMMRALEKYRTAFDALSVASPVLARKEDCAGLIPVLKEMLHFQKEYEYILMGHGTYDEANIRYEQMNEAFQQAGLFNVRIASVEAQPDLKDALRSLQKRENVKKVMLHPFMVVAGDHATHDMAGDKDSYVTRLKEAGYQAEAVVKGLGEYQEFRQIYVNRLLELLHGTFGN